MLAELAAASAGNLARAQELQAHIDLMGPKQQGHAGGGGPGKAGGGSGKAKGSGPRKKSERGRGGGGSAIRASGGEGEGGLPTLPPLTTPTPYFSVTLITPC